MKCTKERLMVMRLRTSIKMGGGGMTNEEAIKVLKYQRGYFCDFKGCPEQQAFTIAIKALEQEPILDKIRAEISAMMPHLGNWMYEEGHIVEQTACEVISDVLQIIDKYKAEREG